MYMKWMTWAGVGMAMMTSVLAVDVKHAPNQPATQYPRAATAQPDRQEVILYVSPDGDDRWSGKRPDGKGPAGPMKTLEQACQAVRTARAETRGQVPVTVLLRGGTYPRTTPWILGPDDSGTAEAPITYTAFPGENPVISGGRMLSGWKQEKGARWFVDFPEVREGRWYFRELFINGERRPHAHWPREGMLQVAGEVDYRYATFDLSNLVTTVQRTTDGWRARIVIPWSDLGETPKSGDVWGFNLGRCDAPATNYSIWSPTFGPFHQTRYWGHVVFVDKAEETEQAVAEALRQIKQRHVELAGPNASPTALPATDPMVLAVCRGGPTATTAVACNQKGEPAKAVTRAAVSWNAADLTIEFTCDDPQVAAKDRARDDLAMFEDDSVEVFLEPTHRHEDNGPWIHIGVSAAGAVSDACGGPIEGRDTTRHLRFKAGDIRADWPNLADVEAVFVQIWTSVRRPIHRVWQDQGVLALRGPMFFFPSRSQGYYLENVLAGLEQPGAWYLDRTAGRLYYHALPGEDVARLEVVAPVATQLLRIEGDVKAGHLVRHVTFRGLSFQHAGWDLPATGYGCGQGDVSLPSTIRWEGAEHCRVERCELAHLATWAVELGRGCKDNAFVGSLFQDLGAGALKIGSTHDAVDDADATERTAITDNRILDGAQLVPSATAIWIGLSGGNLVAHNEIARGFDWGIALGWSWNYFPATRARDNVVEFNHIHHLGDAERGSFCALYTLGLQPGTILRNNYVHHIPVRSTFGGGGIAMDNGSAGMVVENNLVHDTAVGWGCNFNCFGNVIQNNILAYSRTFQLTRYGDPPSGDVQPNGEIFTRNIILWKDAPLFGEKDWWAFQTLWDYNLYWNESGPVQVMKYTFPAWQAKGMDQHSLAADPLFVDPAREDFALKPDSPAFKLGFRPIDLGTVGPRKNMVYSRNEP